MTWGAKSTVVIRAIRVRAAKWVRFDYINYYGFALGNLIGASLRGDVDASLTARRPPCPV